jgi:hypothetical protein
VIALTDRLLPGMRERRWGRSVTLTSSGVVAPIPILGISNALQLSLVGWSKMLAREVARTAARQTSCFRPDRDGSQQVPGRTARQDIRPA